MGCPVPSPHQRGPYVGVTVADLEADVVSADPAGVPDQGPSHPVGDIEADG